jgi:hypothetical protein
MFSPLVHAVFWVCLFAAPLIAEDLASPVFIDPTVQSYSGFFSRKLPAKFFVDEVIDKRSNAPSDTLGMTRTGKNSSAPLVTRLSPSALLKNSILGTFRELSVLSDERIDATYAVEAEMLLFEITETSKGFSQEIKAMVGFRVKIKRVADNELIRQFIITSEDSRKALDTTKFAQTVASNALISGLLRMVENLSWLK